MEGDTEERRPSSADAKMTRVHAPDRQHLENSAVKNGKMFKQRWNTYPILADINELPTIKQQAQFMNCLGDDALDALNSLQMKEDPSVNDIIEAFDEYIIGKMNETYERLNFNKRLQKQDENFEHFHAGLKRMIKTCNYCNQCETSIIKDKIVLGYSFPRCYVLHPVCSQTGCSTEHRGENNTENNKIMLRHKM